MNHLHFHKNSSKINNENNYQEFLKLNPNVYKSFSKIVEHPVHYRILLNNLNFIKDSQNFLSIGAGWGELEIGLLQDHPKSSLSFLDPVPEYADTFTNLINKLDLEKRIDNIFVSILENIEFKQKFDRILSIHSWYGIGENFTSLEKVMNTLNKGGKFFLTIGSESNLTYKLSKECFSSNLTMSAESILNWAQKYFDHEYLEHYHKTPLSKVFDSNENYTKDGEGFLAFHACKPFNQISSETKNKFKNIILNNIADNEIKLDYGCLIFSKN